MRKTFEPEYYCLTKIKDGWLYIKNRWLTNECTSKGSEQKWADKDDIYFRFHSTFGTTSDVSNVKWTQKYPCGRVLSLHLWDDASISIWLIFLIQNIIFFLPSKPASLAYPQYNRPRFFEKPGMKTDRLWLAFVWFKLPFEAEGSGQQLVK